MRLLFAGTPAAATIALEALVSTNHELCAILTRPAAARGRSSELIPSEVAQFAVKNGLKVLTPVKAEQAQTEIQSLQPDLGIAVAYGQILKSDLLEVPRLGWINLHFSLLPAWRGAAPVQRSILAGDKTTGVTVFKLDAGMDTGEILAQRKVEISDDETAGQLLQTLAEVGAQLLVEVVEQLASGTAQLTPQSELGVSYAAKIGRLDARINWRETAEQVSRRIRACAPAPGAFSLINGQIIGIGPVAFQSERSDLKPAQIEIGKQQVLVGTGSHAIELQQIKPAGKNWMDATAWARGLTTLPEGFDAD